MRNTLHALQGDEWVIRVPTTRSGRPRFGTVLDRDGGCMVYGRREH